MSFVHNSQTIRKASRGGISQVWLFTLIFPAWIGLVMAKEVPEQLKQLSMEELMEIDVTSVSRRSEKISSAAAAISVITQQEIRRSGVTSLAEALRLATGVHVARFNSRAWSITTRGFNGSAANKLLVLIDGRSVYTPLFSGVFWDVQDTLLEDVDRIEVIRGPGGTLWGANAVNGVINIITKNSKDSQGTLISAGGGNEEVGFGSVRYGGKLGEQAHYRAYSKYFYRDGQRFANGADALDPLRKGMGGLRIDWEAKSKDSLTFQGDLYSGLLGLAGSPDSNVSGGNLLGRWTRRFSERSELQVQGYFDRTFRRVPMQHAEGRNTYDLELQHHFTPSTRHDLVWGGDVRVTRDQVQGSSVFFLDPDRRTVALYSSFVQDEITLVKNRLRLVIGSKFEHNGFSGFEIQPTARLAWLLSPRQTVWAAISRAVRTPTRVDQDIRIPFASTILIRGDRNFEAENLLANEVGYRVQAHRKLSLDVATFYNIYGDLRSQESPIQGLFPIVLANGFKGESWGAEIEANYQVTPWWRWRAGYTYFAKQLEPKPGSRDFTRGVAEGNDPRNQFLVRSYIDLPKRFELDGGIRYISSLPSPYVPGYAELDLRLAWNVFKSLELSITGQNLLDPQHPEFGPGLPNREEFQRSVYGKITWRF